jgi:hypothetical protein
MANDEKSDATGHIHGLESQAHDETHEEAERHLTGCRRSEAPEGQGNVGDGNHAGEERRKTDAEAEPHHYRESPAGDHGKLEDDAKAPQEHHHPCEEISRAHRRRDPITGGLSDPACSSASWSTP